MKICKLADVLMGSESWDLRSIESQ